MKMYLYELETQAFRLEVQAAALRSEAKLLEEKARCCRVTITDACQVMRAVAKKKNGNWTCCDG